MRAKTGREQPLQGLGVRKLQGPVPLPGEEALPGLGRGRGCGRGQRGQRKRQDRGAWARMKVEKGNTH